VDDTLGMRPDALPALYMRSQMQLMLSFMSVG